MVLKRNAVTAQLHDCLAKVKQEKRAAEEEAEDHEELASALTLTVDERQSYEVGLGTSPFRIFTAARVLSQWVSH